MIRVYNEEERFPKKMSSKTIKPNRINLQYFTCPICKRQGNYIEDEHETICQCGCVITTSYPYTAGQKFKTLSDFQIENKNKKINEKMKKRWKKWK